MDVLHSETGRAGDLDKLLEEVRAGCRAFERLCEYVQPYLYKIATRRASREVKNAVGVETIVQDCLLRFLRDFHSLRNLDADGLKRKLRSILLHIVQQEQRKLARRRTLQAALPRPPRTPPAANGDSPREQRAAGADMDPLPTPCTNAMQCEDMARFRSELGRLPAELRVPLCLKREYGLSTQQVAELLGCEPREVRDRCRLALAELKLRLGNHDES